VHRGLPLDEGSALARRMRLEPAPERLSRRPIGGGVRLADLGEPPRLEFVAHPAHQAGGRPLEDAALRRGGVDRCRRRGRRGTEQGLAGEAALHVVGADRHRRQQLLQALAGQLQLARLILGQRARGDTVGLRQLLLRPAPGLAQAAERETVWRGYGAGHSPSLARAPIERSCRRFRFRDIGSPPVASRAKKVPPADTG